ncbi:U2 small nuclear ribonucleoprotein B''-like [Passer domesticus]|uniref:U2 small nuclear ribonucleoprotein B''-like n=1 Tax=Passer domesticus TaxID=48849 RepID=UPI0030FE4C2C
MAGQDPRPDHSICTNSLEEKSRKDAGGLRVSLELEQSLGAIFWPFGQILDILVRRSLRLRGQAFVPSEEMSSGTNAPRSLQGFPFHGSPRETETGARIQHARPGSASAAEGKGTLVERERERDKRGAKGGEAPAPKRAGPERRGSAGEGAVGKAPKHILFLPQLPEEPEELMLSVLCTRVALVPGRRDIAWLQLDTEVQAGAAREALQGSSITQSSARKISCAKR